MSVREMPLERLLSKAFLKAFELPESEAARLVLAGHQRLRETRFGRLRLGEATWESPGCGELPKDLDFPLAYWTVPWLSKPRRPISLRERLERRLRFRKLVSDFRKLVRIMDWKGWVGPPVLGILLTRKACLVEVKTPLFGDPPIVPESTEGPDTPMNWRTQEVFLFTDGNRRIGVAAAVGILKIPVRVSHLLTFDWKATKAIGPLRFSEADTRRIWEHVWERVNGTSSAA